MTSLVLHLHILVRLSRILHNNGTAYPDPAVGPRSSVRRVGGRGGGGAASGASPGEASAGADLGGSSNYSNEIFED